jgi:hypothetical protein
MLQWCNRAFDLTRPNTLNFYSLPVLPAPVRDARSRVLRVGSRATRSGEDFLPGWGSASAQLRLRETLIKSLRSSSAAKAAVILRQ